MKYLINDGLPGMFILFYLVGLGLYFTPLTRHLFIQITPYSLILVFLAVFFHHKKWNSKTIVVLASIFILSVLSEIIGVATGQLFGVYSYGEGLGIKIADVPLVIGLNWVFLVYSSHGIISKYTSNKSIIIFGAALLMVIYDVVLEKVAPLMDMWQFSNNNPPINNYVVWFLLALFFNWLIQKLEINTLNLPARSLFFIQLVFFVIIVFPIYF